MNMRQKRIGGRKERDSDQDFYHDSSGETCKSHVGGGYRAVLEYGYIQNDVISVTVVPQEIASDR